MTGNMRGWLLAWAMLGCVSLGACAALKSLDLGKPEYWVKPGSARPGSEVESLLMYFEYAKKLSGNDLNKEHEQVKQAFANSKSDFARLQYVLLLVMSGAAFRDEGRALGLLDPLLKENAAASPGLRTFAYFLNAEIAEHRRLEDGAQTVNQKWREEQKRSEALQQKLDAIKSIEKTMIEREQSIPPRSK